MKNRRMVAFVLTAAVVGVLALFAAMSPGSPEKGDVVDCDIDRGPCTKPLGETGITATFDIVPKPVKTMKRLSFRIALKKGDVPVTDGAVSLSLSMPGMSMAENLVPLLHRGGGRYEGGGVMVRCPSGNKVRRAEARVSRPSGHEESTRHVRYTFRVK